MASACRVGLEAFPLLAARNLIATMWWDHRFCACGCVLTAVGNQTDRANG